MINKPLNRSLDSETAHGRASTFDIFLIICSSVTVRCAQFRAARR